MVRNGSAMKVCWFAEQIGSLQTGGNGILSTRLPALTGGGNGGRGMGPKQARDAPDAWTLVGLPSPNVIELPVRRAA
jgi:hypothetical protein